MLLRAHVGERPGRLPRAAAERAQKLPAQVEQTRARRVKEEFEHVAARRSPRVCERVGAHARERQLVAARDRLAEARGRVPVGAAFDEPAAEFLILAR